MKKRELFFYKEYFKEFLLTLTPKARKKLIWVLKLVEELDRIPEIFFKYIENTDGIYEIRVQAGRNIYRIFCFIDDRNLIVVGHGFHKKTQKTPVNEIEKAITIKKAYYEEKKSHQP